MFGTRYFGDHIPLNWNVTHLQGTPMHRGPRDSHAEVPSSGCERNRKLVPAKRDSCLGRGVVDEVKVIREEQTVATRERRRNLERRFGRRA